jgi:hypothetical protein
MVRLITSSIVIASVLETSGAVFDFALQGSSTSGLSYANEPFNPSRTLSTGTGTAAGPIQYDNSSQQLTFVVNFTGLTSGATGAAIRFGNLDNSNTGSIVPGTQLYDLTPYINGGSSTSGSIEVPGINPPLTLVENPLPNYSVVQQEADLNAGNWYIEIATTVNGGGEIRGNLVPVPEPQTCAALTGIGLVGFALFRKLRLSQMN